MKIKLILAIKKKEVGRWGLLRAAGSDKIIKINLTLTKYREYGGSLQISLHVRGVYISPSQIYPHFFFLVKADFPVWSFKKHYGT